MIGAAAPSPRLGRPHLGVLAGAASTIFAVLVVGSVIVERDHESHSRIRSVSPRDLQATLAYADAIAPPTHLAGQAIVLGIRADIPDFRSGKISVEVWQADMEARAAEFSRAGATFRAVPAPKVLGDASRQFDKAFETYLRAAEILRRAGDVAGPERDRLISLGAQIGDEGDAAFDRGAASIQRIRRAVRMEPDLRFPDKERS
jgi:hypothetical protein